MLVRPVGYSLPRGGRSICLSDGLTHAAIQRGCHVGSSHSIASIKRLYKHCRVSASLADGPLEGQEGRESLPDSFVNRNPSLGGVEVLRRAALSIGAIALYRLGCYVPLPRVKLISLPSTVQAAGQDTMLAGHDPVAANIFLLGITPIIAASILTSLWAVLPWTRDIGRKEGREGEASMRLTTRLLAALFALFMGTQTAFRLLPFAVSRQGFVLDTCLTLTAGTMVLMHLAEEVTAHGLGEGISLMVATSILQRQSASVRKIAEMSMQGLVLPWHLLAGTGTLLLLVYAAISVALIEKQYQIISYRFKSRERRRRKHEEDCSRTLPIRISPSGVSVLLTVSLYLSYLPTLLGFWNSGLKLRLSAWLMSARVLPFAVSILAFFLVSLDLTFGRMLSDLTSWMQRSSAGIKHRPPLLPGLSTQRFLSRQRSLTHFWGGLAVATLGGVAFAVDQVSLQHLGVEMGAVSVLLLTGQVTVIYNQVEAMTAIPRLGRRLLSERSFLSSLIQHQ